MNTLYQGQCHCHCHCQNIRFELNLSRALNEFHSRRCDCDFCLQYDIHYLSDNQGYLKIAESSLTNFVTQGAKLAHFIQCENCAQIVAAYHCFGPRNTTYRCAVNSQLLINNDQLQTAESVSPKLLSVEQKLKRWREIWMPIHFSDPSSLNEK